MKIFVVSLLFIVSASLAACDSSHSMECVVVSGQKVCFVRHVWGLLGNSDRVTLTTNANVCHEPSNESDFVSKMMGAGERVYYKVNGDALYVFGVAQEWRKPETSFPVKVIFDDLGLSNPTDEVLSREGYKRLNLNNLTWCFSDIF